jgi:hypothetical protein
VVVVLDKANADAILRGTSEKREGVGAAITGRYLGLHDNASASITLVDPDETVVLWASETGDRSLMWGVMARGGQRKVADRLVNNLKKALSAAAKSSAQSDPRLEAAGAGGRRLRTRITGARLRLHPPAGTSGFESPLLHHLGIRPG